MDYSKELYRLEEEVKRKQLDLRALQADIAFYKSLEAEATKKRFNYKTVVTCWHCKFRNKEPFPTREDPYGIRFTYCSAIDTKVSLKGTCSQVEEREEDE